MKKLTLALLLAAAVSGAALYIAKSAGADSVSFQTTEFVTIRWEGRENSHVIRPSGKIEKLKQVFDRYPRPAGMDERSYYMNVAMNAVAKEGYDLAGVTPDEIVMKRPVAR
jgi:hypothetical protein